MNKKFLSFFFILLVLCLGTNLFAQSHLLLTEATVTLASDEFLEIYNPTGVTVELTNYYLSDDDDYALYPGTFGNGPSPVIDFSDFIVRFPPGEMIAAGQVVVIAFDGAGFLVTFGFAADYEINGTDPGTPDMIPSNLGASAGLSNGGENACLFYWDGFFDLVMDVDMFRIGIPSAANDIGDKTGVSVDGPDADILATAYLPDGYTMSQQPSAPGVGFSTKRILLEGANEVNTSGNGITGHDETTENILETWDIIFVAPDPGVVGPGVLVGVNVDVTAPVNFELAQNYPNPFNPTTNIEYQIPDKGYVTLLVYDVLGNEIATLINEEKSIGAYEVEFSAIGGSASGGNAHALPSGIYFYRIQVYAPGREGSFVGTKKMVLMK